MSSPAVCPLCPHGCALAEGQIGRCHARIARDGRVVLRSPGLVSSLAVDPIEKKPLRLFHPGSLVLSVGFFGCNMTCPFCQNWPISTTGGSARTGEIFTAARLVELARRTGGLGLAYTYNEPLTSFEFVAETARLIHRAGLRNVLITNGCFNSSVVETIAPLIDGWNIDLKGFSASWYHHLGGDLETVKATIAIATLHGHVELTCLIVPGSNDHDDEMDAMARWIGSIDREIALHISRYFPCHHATTPATPVETIDRLIRIASAHLRHVFRGNC